MKKLSQMVIEARPASVTNDITVKAAEWSKWEKFLKKSNLSKDFWTLNEILKNNGIFDAKTWDKLRYGNSSEQRSVASNLGIDQSDFLTMVSLIKSLGGELNAIPMSISNAARESIMSNPKLLDDLLVDRQSNAGVKAMIKQYTPMIKKMVFKYSTCTPLDKAELLSICQIALLEAGRKYMRGDKETAMQFTGFLQFVMFQAIQNELHKNGYTIRLPQSEQEQLMKCGSVNTVRSYDGMTSKDGDDYEADKLAFLGGEEDKVDNAEDPDKFKMLMDLIEKKFGTQKSEVFFMYFGVNGYKKTQGKDIAKKIGKSPAMIVKIVKEITEWLKSQVGKGAIGDLIDYLNDVYVEGLMTTCIGLTKDALYESLMSDEIYVTLQEALANKVCRKDVEKATERLDIESANYIYQCLKKGYEYLDKTYRKNKEAIIDFLYDLFPATNIMKMSDVELLEMMKQVINSK